MSAAPAEVAAALGAALDGADRELLGTILAPDVRWGGEEETPETCHSREDVLEWYGRLHDRGVRAQVAETDLYPSAVVLGLRVIWPDRDAAGPSRVWQIYTIADGLVTDIRGFPDRDEALAFAVSR